MKNRRFGQNLQLFSSRLPCFVVCVNFSAKSCKKYLIWRKSMKNRRFGQNVELFSSRLPCFGVWVNFPAKRCKKCLISRKSMKNRRFGQNVELFCRHYCLSAFGSTLKQKAPKRALFPEKAWKIVDLAKSWHFFEGTTMFRRLVELFGKKLQKMPHFARKPENSSTWPKLATFSR